ncbi:aldo/keto reductase [Streptomyces formicae]|uniref:L-fuco-beta-pyranose dehydrogenase n=1 Tax=Streptomyces formicae TaxID=1616117 RepID=A0A291QMD9_9ACTN|nr:aldo/keto reductase [Streptomyces formicae]ATL32605.1 L-fuco-beta-pyranose dehydrogenase [Streptomyces formicae]
MKTHRIGSTSVRVTELALGGGSLGGMYTPVPAPQAAATVRRALDRGLRYIDTAPHYAAGIAERRLGDALAAEDRARYTLSTKVGRLLRPADRAHLDHPDRETDVDPRLYPDEPPTARIRDFTRDGVLRALEESLTRLGLDHVDIVYLHDTHHHERLATESAFPALAELRAQSVIGAIGVGLNDAAMLTRFVRGLDLDVILCAGRYTLLEQPALHELLPACEQRGVSVVIGGVYNSGLLVAPQPGAPYNYTPAPAPILARARRLNEVCRAHAVPLRAAALHFPLRHPSVVSVLTGCRSPQEVDDNVVLYERPIPQALWDDLESAGLVTGAV